MLDDILLQVNKPGRYMGQEWNISKKDFNKSEIKFALCFPDLYEVGMSNLGFRILYGILNNIKDVCCERFFAPDTDMERILRTRHLEIFSLESKNSLKEFDIIGFSLGFELNYTNVLNILELGRVPIKSSLRDHTHPLVIGGGPCVANPEPIYEIFDLFVIGEAEEAILEILDVYREFKHKFKTSNINKEELLVMLSNIKGIYVPSLYDVIYDSRGKIEEFRPRPEGIHTRIKKRFVKDLDKAYFPLDWLIPNIGIIHDRITLEIMRGCPNSCRFCQGRSQYFPYRIRNIRNILNLAHNVYKRTGYEEVSLSGLSVSDYSNIGLLLGYLTDLFKERKVSVSLSSLKPNIGLEIFSAIAAKVKKTGLTFAPEAATEKLRKIIAKDFDTPDFLKTIELAYSLGYRHIKLYFLIGLPYEEKEDLDAIIEFSKQVSRLRGKTNSKSGEVNLSINALIPKPHTPFQWLKMEDIESIKHKQEYLRNKVKGHNKLRLKFHNRYMSFLEGVLSRGDRRLGEVIVRAFEGGARFDAWDNHFRWDIWQDAFSKSNIDPNFYLQASSKDELLPWDFIDVGISKVSLIKEAVE